MIITGITKLDEIFKNTSGIILDIFGKNGSGKTQFLFQMCVNAIKSGGTVLYIDTNSGFRPERILELAKKFNLTIHNTGELPINFTRFWINNVTDSTWPLQNFTLNKVSTPQETITNNY